MNARQMVARYRTRLRELMPAEVKDSRLGRLRVGSTGLLVLVVLDLNDWLIARFAPDIPARWDPNTFPWAADVEAASPAMKREVEQYLLHRNVPVTAEINGLDPDSDEARASVPTDVGAWRSLVLQWFGEDIEANARHFPETMAAVRDLGVTSAGFTVLDPRAHIPTHQGPNRGAVRYQLPIIVPGPPGACRIRVGDEMIPWSEGSCVVFDLFVNHEVWNDTDRIRVLLMLEVPMPLSFPLSISNNIAQRLFGRFPTFRGLPDRVTRLANDPRHDVEPAVGTAGVSR